MLELFRGYVIWLMFDTKQTFYLWFISPDLRNKSNYISY